MFRAHQLSDEAERLLHEKEVTGRAAWNRLFDESIAGLRVPVGGQELTVSDATVSADRQAVRACVAVAVASRSASSADR